MNALAAFVVLISAWIVPRARRADWIEEWRAELWALVNDRDRPVGVFELLAFLSGAPRHAWVERLDGWSVVDLSRDFREAARHLRRAPGVAVGSILITAIAVAANAAIFSVVNATLLRTAPGIADPGRLVQIGRGKADGSFDPLSYPAFADLRAHATAFEKLAAFSQDRFVVDDGAGPRLAAGQFITSGYFGLLGTGLTMGQEFTSDEERPGAAVAVISHAYWRRRFSARAEAIGATITVNATPVRIVGVAPRGFVGHSVGGAVPELWLPPGFAGADAVSGPASRLHSWLWVVGRMRPGIAMPQARDELGSAHQAIESAHPGTMGARLQIVQGLGLRPHEREEARTIMVLLMGSVVLVLVIACANVAGLLLAHAAARRLDLAIRLALGASRFRVMREMMAESLVIALCAGAAACSVAAWTAAGVRRLLPYELAVDFAPDWRVFAFTLTTAIVTGLLIGLLPAARAARTDLMGVIREAATDRAAGRMRTALVIVQLALAFVLVAGTSVLVRSLANARYLDTGFAVDRVQTVSVNLDLLNWDLPRSRAFVAGLSQDLRDRPGVAAAGFARRLPVADPQSRRSVSAEPMGFSDDAVPRTAVASVVDERFFETLEIPLMRGRGFGPLDRHGSEPVAVVSEHLARELWGPDDPIGRLVHMGLDAVQVVGVARDVRARSLGEGLSSIVYLPLAQHPAGDLTVIVRGATEPPSVDAIKAIVAGHAPGVPIVRAATLGSLIRASMGATELTATLLALYGALTLLLSATAVYALVAQSTRARSRELGIRLAVGASPGRLQWAVVVGALRLSVVGIALGACATAAAGGALERLLLGTSATDPASLLAAAVLFLAIAAGSAWGPARRAASGDPVAALRGD